MKFLKLSLGALLACALSATMLMGCQQQSAWNENEEFTYSKGIDENGYWKDVRALDYVTLNDNYLETEVPSDISVVSESDIQTQIDSLMASHSSTEKITDRAIEEGDTVNIDYVGSVDGIEFDGGSTNGSGTDVVAGSADYIDDFLTQIIGHTPGETFNVEVTFPDDYGKEELNGKDAVFVTTINFIAAETEAELTDSFVKENLVSQYGWTTVDEMKEGVEANIQKEAIDKYVSESILKKGNVSSMPELLTKYNEATMYQFYKSSAESRGMELDEYLSSSAGVESMEELLESNKETIRSNSEYALIVQAMAEDQGIEVTEEDVAEYFKSRGNEDYSSYEADYGMPYLKQVVISQKIYDLLINNVRIA